MNPLRPPVAPDVEPTEWLDFGEEYAKICETLTQDPAPRSTPLDEIQL